MASQRKPKPEFISASPRAPLHPHLEALAPYPPGKPIEEAQREYGLDHFIKLASNENPLGPSPKALKAMATVAGEMNLYPDGAGFYLKRELAAKLGVTPEEIVLGAGSDEITVFLALCYLGPGVNIVTSECAFVRYRMAAQMMGAETKLVPMRDLAHDAKALAAAVDKNTRIVFIDNPCNPTGAMTPDAELGRGLIHSVPPETLIVIDEAYYEYAVADPAYPDTMKFRKKHPNVIITRTFSKAYGLAGLRVGYGIARPEIVRDLERVRPPFNVNRMAQAAAVAALGDARHVERAVKLNEKGRAWLTRGMEKLGARVYPSWANFLLVDFAALGVAGGVVYEELMRRGVIVRPMGGYGLRNMVRISIGLMEENQILVAALKEILG